MDWSVNGFPCPVENVTTFMNTYAASWRMESQSANMVSVIALYTLAQFGGIPAPVRGEPISVCMWAIWMTLQLVQLLLIVFSLSYVVLAYWRMSEVRCITYRLTVSPLTL